MAKGRDQDCRLEDYELDGFFDELIDVDGQARPDASALIRLLAKVPVEELRNRQHAIERTLFRMGVTFTVYSDSAGTEKIMPFDLIPRIISAMQWRHIEAGLKQRIAALNLFLTDIYGPKRIIQDGVIDEHTVRSASGYIPQCEGLRPFGDVWCHITGTDLVRNEDGGFYVLEDNLRCPSGASYVLQNRAQMKTNFAKVFAKSRVRPVSDYPSRMYRMLRKIAPPHVDDPLVAVLTPGVFNSAYYEHSFFAQQMGVRLVEGRDLIVDDNDVVYMKTVNGLRRVDVLYRRIDDAFLDPEAFRKDSMLGVSGLMRSFRAGNVSLANAPGTGVADDKVVYAYVPEMIRYYLGSEPILSNVPTYLCHRDEDREYVLSHMHELVVKAAAESGGYGLIVGPHATQAERDEFAAKIIANPRNYIAQPTLSLSRVPTLTEEGIEGRHVDLRPYVLCAGNADIDVMPGGLTRVALRKGSLVVNSSQGGGSKDTWVIAGEGEDLAELKLPAKVPEDLIQET
ncbi:MAG: circularly permuted type 2 ATP-grasp protein [Planctomycetota bacterium]